MTRITINGRAMEGAVYVTIGGERADLHGVTEASYREARPLVVDVALEDAGPAADIQRAMRMAWADAKPIEAGLAWCGSCGMSAEDCACGVMQAIRDRVAADTHAATMRLLPPPPEPGANRAERRARAARKRRAR